MASSLSRKLNIMTSGAPKPAPRRETHTIIREHREPVSDEVYRLNRDALLDMGLTGGEFDIERTLFIDTETTGLSGGAGTVAFLVGCGFIRKGSITVRQYLIPDYSCEAEMLNELASLFSAFDTVVHFNGTRFDMPLLKERFTMKRLDGVWRELEQLDLLKPARKVWKLRLGCCRLKYIEEAILGMPRGKDIDGADIPARYFESVKTQNPSLLDDIVSHNLQDILTLTQLLVKLNGIFAKPEETTEQLDMFSLGRAFESLGRLSTAKKLYKLAAIPRAVHTARDFRNEKYAGEANMRLFHMYRRAGEFEKCEATLLNMIKRRQMDDAPYIELAKLYEHRLNRLQDALSITERLLLKSDDPALITRRDRLRNKLKNQGG